MVVAFENHTSFTSAFRFLIKSIGQNEYIF